MYKLEIPFLFNKLSLAAGHLLVSMKVVGNKQASNLSDKMIPVHWACTMIRPSNNLE